VSCALILVGGGLNTDMSTWPSTRASRRSPARSPSTSLTDEYLAEHGTGCRCRRSARSPRPWPKSWPAGIPLVGHNLGFDLNLLNAECERHLGDSLEGICRQPLTRVIDTMVLDKHCAPYRRRVSEKQGPYQMRTTAEVYGLEWDEESAHGAAYDALQSARAAYRMGAIAHTRPEERPDWVLQLRNRRGPYERFSDLAFVDVEELHRRQVVWAAEHAASYQAWLRNPEKSGDKHDANAVIDGSWPLRPAGGAS
jgi:DNA polymerase-3 subunit epsilon